MPTATQAPPQINRFRKVADSLPVSPLLYELERNPELWGRHTWRQDYPGSAHHDTQAILLRMPRVITPHSIFNDLEAVDWPEYDRLPSARWLVEGVCRTVGATKLGRVMIVSLKPGGSIDPHVDEGDYADHYDRFHVDLYGSSAFTVDSESVEMAVGDAWWFNHKREHRVVNGSDGPRIHLIIDAVSPRFRAIREGQTRLSPEPLTEALKAEAIPLLRSHYEEIAHYRDIPMDPDWDAYDALQKSGMLRICTARTGDGELVGYVCHIVRPHLHYRSALTAIQDVVFLREDHRGGGLGMKLIAFADQRLAGEGVKITMQHVKAAHDFGPLLERMGYELVDHLYCRRL